MLTSLLAPPTPPDDNGSRDSDVPIARSGPQAMSTRWQLTAVTLCLILAAPFALNADIYRWDNGQVIPGTEGIAPGPGVQLDHMDLDSASLGGMDLTGANFEGSNLRSAWLYKATLTNSNLTGANFWDAELSEADLLGAIVTRTKFSDTTPAWRGFTKEQLYSTASYQAGNLQGISLAGDDLSGWNFQGQNLSDADLRQTVLTGAQLSGANLSRADLRDAIDFPAADPAIISRNTISDTGHIIGLELATGELLTVRLEREMSGGGASVSEALHVAEGGTLEMHVGNACGDCPASARLFIAPGTSIRLGGVLRLLLADEFPFGRMSPNDELRQATYHLFDWVADLDENNVFGDIELPAGSWDTSRLYTLGDVELLNRYRGDGDFNVDGQINTRDVDQLISAMARRDISYDADGDYVLNREDLRAWVHGSANTYFGDADLDGEFNSSDFVQVFQTGKYETGEDGGLVRRRLGRRRRVR